MRVQVPVVGEDKGDNVLLADALSLCLALLEGMLILELGAHVVYDVRCRLLCGVLYVLVWCYLQVCRLWDG